ncbi:alpha/beta hydrolase [Kitasatospora nipponensis]|uniref:Alpha/beta hydrolase n=1 Tax=Kitasatospora nipponensis TaxID=258049 RepID=A0ABN1X014_9ACTN
MTVTTAHTVSTAVTVADATIPYRVEGDGPRLVLVHGTGPTADLTWGALLGRFTDRFTVVLPDLSGTEPVRDDGTPLTLDRLARQLIAVIEATDDGAPVALAGFSQGAPVAAAAAALRPDLVDRLVMIAGWGRPDEEYVRNLMATWRAITDPDAFGRFALLTGFSRPFLNGIGHAQVEQLAGNLPPTANLLRQLDLNLRIDLRELLPRITARTLSIGLTQDATIPVEHARELHAALPGSRYAEIDSGHVVVFEQPDELVRLVRGFLLEQPDAQAPAGEDATA